MLYKVTKDSKLPSLVLTRRTLLAGSPKQHKPVIQPEGLVKAPSCLKQSFLLLYCCTLSLQIVWNIAQNRQTECHTKSYLKIKRFVKLRIACFLLHFRLLLVIPVPMRYFFLKNQKQLKHTIINIFLSRRASAFKFKVFLCVILEFTD